jgi:hypothetical protein
MEFPDWVEGPTVCTVRSFSAVVPAFNQHRGRKMVMQFPQRETVTLRHIETGRLHTGWVDFNFDPDKFEIVSAQEEN